MPVLERLEPRLLLDGDQLPPPIVINEIHYDPDVRTDLAEFVELYNAGDSTEDLSGWSLDNAIEYTFGPGTQIAPGGYLVVAEDPPTVQSKFGASALGPWLGRLDNDGDKIVLRDERGVKVDEVDYQRGFPWPTVGEPPGHSIELVHPELDNDLGGSWRPSTAEAIHEPVTFIDDGARWSYRKGTSEASSPINAWREVEFVMDSTWAEGNLFIGYGEDFLSTRLNDMRNKYTCVFLRKTFQVDDPAAVGNLIIEAVYDDGFLAWVNDQFIKAVNVSKPEIPYTSTAGSAIEDKDWNTFAAEGPHPSTYLRAGTNVLAIQLFNSSLGGSSDCFLDVRLKETSGAGAGGPTPGRQNASYAPNIPPQMRQVEPSPAQPAGGEPVRITAKITDDDGVASVMLHYQLVDPGAYIELDDAEYDTNWTTVAMTDDGLGGDEQAGDDTYTVVLPASLQVHRRLVRYRITAEDATGLSRTGPYADDPVPNFAYFVYDGLPAWSGAIDPGSSTPALAEAVEYGPDVLGSVPVYHLITKKGSVEHSQWIDQYGGDLYKWSGTLVYDGEVYDHIRYRARGGCWRYAMGKNMWKFDFNRGHSFQARDDYGRKYDTKWDKLNFSACIQQGDYQHRGEQGMFEAATFKLFNLMGVEAPETHWVHFRVIDEAPEAGPTQYDGDFWGLYMAIEQMDGRFLDEHDLPDGNLYKIEGHNGELNNQGPTAVTDKSDLNAFKSGYYHDPNPTEQWWRDNVNLDSYYSYRAVVEGTHHGDIAYGKNYFFYLDPETGIWTMLPWDVDLTWANNMYGNGEDPFRSQGGILNHPALQLELKNRIREFYDLLYNPEQMSLLLDEMASFIDDPAGGPSLVDADRALWDYNPIMTSSYINLSKAGEGRFYQKAATKDFPGMVRIMKDYVVSPYRAFATNVSDPDLPATPTIRYAGPLTCPVNRLRFGTSPFSDATGAFAAMEWRIAEVTDPDAPAYDPDAPLKLEIEAVWESGELTAFQDEIAAPPEGLEPGHAYRARVRMKDSTGRWSRWSEPVQFVAGEQDETDLLNSLRVTEIMYNPAAPPEGSPYRGDDFEFVELQNVGDQTLDLTHVSFTEGIRFSFAGSAVTSLAPGQYVVVVKDLDAFQTRYDTAGMNLAGEFQEDSGLADGGEEVELFDAVDGMILEFGFHDDWYPVTDGEGFSLTIRDPAGDRALWDLEEGWQASAALHGTPGAGDDGMRPGSVVINEVLAHSDGGVEDWIELHNTTDEDIDIGGWFLSDSADDLRQYRIPDGTEIPDGGYVVFNQVEHFGPAVNPTGFALSEFGDDVYLTSADAEGNLGGYREHVDFGASANSITVGLYVKSTGSTDFTHLAEPTMNGPNAGPLFGPLVINEVMYHPTDPQPGSGYLDEDFEFVELYNRSGTTLNLTEFYLAEGIGFTFGWYLTDTLGTAVWTLESGATASWQAALGAAGVYEVLVWLDPADGLDGVLPLDSQAQYQVDHDGGTTPVEVNQNVETARWVSLGSFSFSAGSGTVRLLRGSDDPAERTFADRVKLVRGGTEVVVDNADTLAFTATGTDVTSLAPGEFVVVVRSRAAFEQRYGTTGVTIAGGYSGNLSNSGEKLKVYRKGNPELTGYIPYLRSDYVNYRDAGWWPVEADGLGSSLSRLADDEYGNDPANWAPSTAGGTPGAANVTLDTTPPSVPTDLAAVPVGTQQIDLGWTASIDLESGIHHYVVYRNGSPIATPASPSYSDFDVTIGVDYSYRVAAVNSDELASDPSDPIELKLAGLVSAGAADQQSVRVVFSEALDPASAERAANYVIDGVTVVSARMEADDVSVMLSTSPLTLEQAYTLTVNGVRTLSGNAIAPDSQVAFQYVSWEGADIGNVAAAGSHSFDGQAWTVEGSGLDIWGGSDEFYYVYQPLTGDGEIIARVLSLTNTSTWAKVGVMFRDSLADNAAFAMTVCTPGNGAVFQGRRTAGDGCFWNDTASYSLPHWIRLVRHGSAIASFVSADGVNWTQLGSDTVDLGDTIYAGLSVTAHYDGMLCRAVYDNVFVIEYAGPDPVAHIAEVDPDPRQTPVDEVTVVFDRPVRGVDALDFSILRDGLVVLPTGSESVSTVDRITYTLSGLADRTDEPGIYALILHAAGSDITDVLGNPLQSNATETWVFGVPAPVVTVDPLTTSDPTPALSGTVNDPAADVLVTVDGNDYPATNHGDGTWTLPSGTIHPPLGEGTYDVQAAATDPAGNTGYDATTNELTVAVPPTVTAFERNDGAERPGELACLSLQFSEDVSGSLDAGDLTLRNDTTQENLSPTAGLEYDGETARWDLSDATIVPGYYTVILSAAGVTGASGLPLDGDGNGEGGDDYERSLMVAAVGDTDLDGTVGMLDYLAIKRHYGTTGAGWAEGDSDYDGDVDYDDYAAAQEQFGQSMSAGAAEVLAGVLAPASAAPSTAAPAGSAASEPAAPAADGATVSADALAGETTGLAATGLVTVGGPTVYAAAAAADLPPAEPQAAGTTDVPPAPPLASQPTGDEAARALNADLLDPLRAADMLPLWGR